MIRYRLLDKKAYCCQLTKTANSALVLMALPEIKNCHSKWSGKSIIQYQSVKYKVLL